MKSKKNWTMVWLGIPGLRPATYAVSGTMVEVLDDFRRRFPIVPISNARLTQEDIDYVTIRVDFCDGSSVALFVADKE